jgi:hypothetical protein
MTDDERKQAKTESDDYSELCRLCGNSLTPSEVRDGYGICYPCENDEDDHFHEDLS